MSENVIFWLFLIPYMLGGIALVISVLKVTIPYMKDEAEWRRYDAAWNTYNTAYLEWEENGRIGPMPRFKDYGEHYKGGE